MTTTELEALVHEGREVDRAVADYCRKLARVPYVRPDVDNVHEFLTRSLAEEAVARALSVVARVREVTGECEDAYETMWLRIPMDDDNETGRIRA